MVRVFGVAFVSSDEIVYLAFFGGKLLLQMGVKNYVFLDWKQAFFHLVNLREQ